MIAGWERALCEVVLATVARSRRSVASEQGSYPLRRLGQSVGGTRHSRMGQCFRRSVTRRTASITMKANDIRLESGCRLNYPFTGHRLFVPFQQAGRAPRPAE